MNFKDEIDTLVSKYFQPTNSGYSHQLPLDIDPFYSDIKDKFPRHSKGNLSQLGKVDFKQLRHKNLLWLYRNSLVHEYRIPGDGIEPISRQLHNPCYQEIFTVSEDNMEDLKIVHKNFELLYPIDFFRQICEECLYSIADEYRIKNESPYEVYSEGEYWIPKFNE